MGDNNVSRMFLEPIGYPARAGPLEDKEVKLTSFYIKCCDITIQLGFSQGRMFSGFLSGDLESSL